MSPSLTTTKTSGPGKYWKRPNVPLVVLGRLRWAEFGGPLAKVSFWQVRRLLTVSGVMMYTLSPWFGQPTKSFATLSNAMPGVPEPIGFTPPFRNSAQLGSAIVASVQSCCAVLAGLLMSATRTPLSAGQVPSEHPPTNTKSLRVGSIAPNTYPVKKPSFAEMSVYVFV